MYSKMAESPSSTPYQRSLPSPHDDWEFEGHNDDARSWCSQKSESGSHLSAAICNDGRDYPLHSSVRSIGSVGSQEDVLSLGRHLACAAVAQTVNGEARFPSAMSCVSDAQRSDVATVCSGSVVDDIEVESVLSQDDPAPALSVFSSFADKVARKPNSASEFSTDTSVLPRAESLPASCQPTSPEAAEEHYLPPFHGMGPPLSRNLLMQQAEGAFFPFRTSSVKSFESNAYSDGHGEGGPHSDDGAGSLDVETHFLHSNGDAHDLPGSTDLKQLQRSTPPIKPNISPEDDCGNSLDVETHSVDTRSILSKDDNIQSVADAPCESLACFDEEKPHNLSRDKNIAQNGRISPGGTMYQGHRNRRHEDGYMHLPLNRFRRNGVHPDSVRNNFHAHDHYNDDVLGDAYRNGASRRRSRSRSRSPEHECSRKQAAQPSYPLDRARGFGDRYREDQPEG